MNSVQAHVYRSVSAFCQILGGWSNVAAAVMQRSQAVRHAWMLPPFSYQREAAKLAALASLRQIMRAVSRPTNLRCRTSAGVRNLVGIVVGIVSKQIALLFGNTSWRANGSVMLTVRQALWRSEVRDELASALTHALTKCVLSLFEKQPRMCDANCGMYISYCASRAYGSRSQVWRWGRCCGVLEVRVGLVGGVSVANDGS